MTSRDPKGQTRDLNSLWAQYLENSWTCYVATIANYYNKCKKHSLSHQLSAQLHIENSENKKKWW